MVKYWFGYINFHGKMCPITSVTNDGIAVGSTIQFVQKHEIPEREWETATLAELVMKYPFVEDNVESK